MGLYWLLRFGGEGGTSGFRGPKLPLHSPQVGTHIVEEVPEHGHSIDGQLDLGVELDPIHRQVLVLESSNDVTTVPHHMTGGWGFHH